MSFNDIKNRILENWPAKILCLALAFFLYFANLSQSLETRHLSIKIDVKSEGQVLPVSTLPEYVRVTFRGKPEDIALVKESDVVAVLDVSRHTKTGRYDIPVELQLSETATSISPLEINVQPAHLSIRLEEKDVAYVPLKASFAGKPAQGFLLDSYKVSPDTVRITGPKSIVENVLELRTTAVKIDGLKTRTVQNVSIEKINNLITIDEPEKISVTATILPKKIERTISGNKILFSNVKDSLNISTASESFAITISGSQNLLQNFSLAPSSIQVDCASIEDAGTYTLPLKPFLPDDFSLISISPEKITVIAELIPKEVSDSEDNAEDKVETLLNSDSDDE